MVLVLVDGYGFRQEYFRLLRDGIYKMDQLHPRHKMKFLLVDDLADWNISTVVD